MGDPRNCIDGTADFIDVLLKYGLKTPDEIKEIIKKAGPEINKLLSTGFFNADVAHLIDVLMSRAVFKPSEIKELLNL